MHTANVFTSSPLVVVPTTVGFTIWEESLVDLGFNESLAIVHLATPHGHQLAQLFTAAPQMHTAIAAALAKLDTMPMLKGLMADEVKNLQHALQIATICTPPEYYVPSMRKPVDLPTISEKKPIMVEEWLSKLLTLRLWRKSGGQARSLLAKALSGR